MRPVLTHHNATNGKTNITNPPTMISTAVDTRIHNRPCSSTETSEMAGPNAARTGRTCTGAD